MNPSFIRAIYKPVVHRVVRQIMMGRCRDRSDVKKGRFTETELDSMLKQTWKEYDHRAPSVPRMQTLGAQMNILLCCLTLVYFRVLLSSGIKREYAIELISDISWRVYEKWGKLVIKTVRLVWRNPAKQIHMANTVFSRFLFPAPDFRFEQVLNEEGISLDTIHCPVAEYLCAEDASDLCFGAWCNVDFALAEMWGMRLERTGTLAQGAKRCDFRFTLLKATKKKRFCH